MNIAGTRNIRGHAIDPPLEDPAYWKQDYDDEVEEIQMKNLFKIPHDAEIQDKSASVFIKMKRIFIKFKNGNDISIIQGEYSHGGEEGLYEIMPGDYNYNLKNTPLELIDNVVKGYLSVDEVNEYIEALNKKV